MSLGRAPRCRQHIKSLASILNDDSLTAEEIADRLIHNYPEIVEIEKNDLIKIALVKIVGSTISPRGTTKAEDAQLELFASSLIQKRIPLRLSGGKKCTYIQVGNLSVGQLRAAVESNQRRASRRLPKRDPLELLLAEVTNASLSDEVIVGAWYGSRQTAS